MHGVPHAARLGALPAALELVELRLPRALPGALGADRRPLRDRQGRGARRRHRPHRPRRPDSAADRRRARLAPRPRPRRQRPAARGGDLARPGGPPARRRHRPRRLDRPQPDPQRLRLVGPRGRRAARRRRLLRAARPRQGADQGDRAAASSATPSATRATGSRTACAPRPQDGVFFVGDSAGHCLPLSGEGIRTAFYFGIAAGRELRAVLDGEQTQRAGARALRAPSRAATPARSPGRWLCSARSRACRRAR